MKVEYSDYGAGPRLEIYFMNGHAHVITVAQAVELRSMLDEQIREIQHRNGADGTVGKSIPISEHPTIETCPDCFGVGTVMLTRQRVDCGTCLGSGRIITDEKE